MKSTLNLSRRLMQVLAVTLLACSQFFFFGCSSGETTHRYTLTLSNISECGTLSPDKTSIKIKEGEVLTAYKPTVTPKTGAFFIEWQDADGNPFNFDQTITSDLTAYARYVSDIKEFKMVSHGLFTFKQSNSYVPFIAEDYSLYAVSGAVETPLTFTVTETIQSYYPTVKVYNLTVEDFESTVDQGSYDFVLKNCRTEKSISSTIDYSHTVTFKMNNCTYQSSSTYTQRVEKGETATSITPDSIDTGYVFYGWLDSHGNPFDFSTIITDDITLTAKILPVITKVETSGTNSIKVYSAVYKLTKNDITATYTSSTYPEGKTLTLTYQAIGTTTYTCTAFESSDFDFEFETHFTVSVSNGVDTITSEDGYIAPPPAPTDLSVTVEDRGLTFSWTKASGYSYCDYEVYDSSDKQILSGTKYSSSSLFCNKLTNGQEYTFKIRTRYSSRSDFFSETVSISGTPAIVKKDVEYLMLMYLDGDNNLHDGIYLDLNEMEYGIYKSTSTSLEVIALWDGFVGDSETTPQIGSSGSKLYKVGKESSAVTTYVNSTGCVLGSNTKDISYTADWLSTDEVNMSSRQTLINFLTWANAHYNAEKIVLQFSNHGGGPRAARPRYITLKNGMKYKIPSGNERRSMCWDQGSGGKSFLKTSDVSSALNETGFGTDNKLWLIIEDLCLGGSLEEAYQFKDYAQYYLGSPNNVPGLGLPYEKVIPHLTTTDNDKVKFYNVVSDYRTEYKRSASDWNKLLNEITTNYPDLGVTEENLALYDWDACTLTAVDLTKMDAVKTAIDAYAQEILDNDNQEIAGLYFDKSAREITKTASTTTVPLTYGRVIQDSALYRGGLLSYMGSYTWLFELGAVLDNSYNLATELTVGETTYTWSALATKTKEVAKALDDCIVASWRDGNKEFGLYYNIWYSNTSANKYTWGILESGFYGLSISGGTVEMSVSGSNATLLPEKNPDWYKTELAFGKDSKWGDLLEYWFGEN